MRDLLRSTLGGSIRVETELAPDLPAAFVDPTQIELVILNLAINARDAMPSGGVLTVAASVSSSARPRGPRTRRRATMCACASATPATGMSDEVLARAFEPFFTTKEVGKGSGLGLSQVLGMAQQSGGGVIDRLHPGRRAPSWACTCRRPTPFRRRRSRRARPRRR